MNQSSDILNSTVLDFVSATAAKTSTPGGGSVAGVVGALAGALGEMTLNFTRGKKAFAEHAEFHDHLAGRLTRIREMFLSLVADDISAYGMYAEAVKMPDGPEKADAEDLALAASIDVPREMAKLALALLEDLRRLVGRCNQWLVSDLVAAATLGRAVTTLCDLNVRINCRQLFIKNSDAASDIRTGSANDRIKAARLAEEIEQAVKEYLD
ncbi:MAG: cyclodeaminase/cyclohydrolase family protein [Phycisphaerae bacterium]|nr:cyclodeaminase/cyclohydrolase family protein [Phycisphaerae bacterium]